MEQARIAALLEKYWQAETTVEEERLLAEYFRQPSIPQEWEPLRNVFAFFEAEGQVTPGKEFEDRLMERIRQIGDSGIDQSAKGGLPAGTHLSAVTDKSAGVGLSSVTGQSTGADLSNPAPPPPIRIFSHRTSWWAAAAVIILSVAISRLQVPGPATIPGHPIAGATPDSSTKQVASAQMATTQVATIKDTYEDPHQALAAIQKALHIASSKMNQGKTMTQKQMDRMNEGWQSALTN